MSKNIAAQLICAPDRSVQLLERKRSQPCLAGLKVGAPPSFSTISDSNLGLCLWSREIGVGLQEELAELQLDHVDDVRLTTSTDLLEADLAVALDEAGYPPCPRLLADIQRLGQAQAELAQSSGVEIRLEVVESNSCYKFHADYVTCRLLTTYVGQGTQWIEARHREEPEPPIQQLSFGEVGFFKGRLWQDSPTILHRSPPISGTGEQRLLLVIDPVEKV
ncbi:DUF1826 domain-containing protein [Altererythrobacter indicus]|uniref:DUF1826 domain-containing protein n=1 Tax=Altericroceibacterium indicum TaxID=374177 RepID=A0A845ABA4_9SPHN|nr:DUF1826 domain-containing protein [Altericroceibacterium indicum]MXP26281.1 DUF1826 domain-containing protein [Altericroceibacterium indicum]